MNYIKRFIYLFMGKGVNQEDYDNNTVKLISYLFRYGTRGSVGKTKEK